MPKALHAVDGNYSSKQAANSGLVDIQKFHSDYHISREYVDKFQDEVKRKTQEPPINDVRVSLILLFGLAHTCH